MPFTFERLENPDLILVRPKVFSDERGFFLESYKQSDFVENGIDVPFVQDNRSRSSRGVLRGLHFQRYPRAQGKLVFVTRGAVWDVALDLRKTSSFYLKWTAVKLDEIGGQMLFIPAGFAHGFVALSEDADVLYKCSAEYEPKLDAGIRWNDPELRIEWPIQQPIVSVKDQNLPFLEEIERSL